MNVTENVDSFADDDFRKPVYGGEPRPNATPDVANLPYGHCMAHHRWKGNEIMDEVRKHFQVYYSTDHSIIDFQPTNIHLVSFLSEAEIVMGVDHVRRKLARLYKLACQNIRSDLTAAAIYHRTDMTKPSYYQLQKLCVVDMGISMIPLDKITQIPQLLERFKVSIKLKNKFKLSRPVALNRNKESMLALMGVPGINEKQARSLLEKFGSVRDVLKQSPRSLETVVGQRTAQGLLNFYNRDNTL